MLCLRAVSVRWGESRRKSPGLKRGRHWIVQPNEEEPLLTEHEQDELLAAARRIASEAAEAAGEPGRGRVAFNGPAQRRGRPDTRKTTHAHIMLPEGPEDELPRLVRE